MPIDDVVNHLGSCGELALPLQEHQLSFDQVDLPLKDENALLGRGRGLSLLQELSAGPAH